MNPYPRLAEFTAAEVAAMTGLSQDIQRSYRARGKLRPVNLRNNKAVLTINEIAEMGFVSAMEDAGQLQFIGENTARNYSGLVRYWMLKDTRAIVDPEALCEMPTDWVDYWERRDKDDRAAHRFLFIEGGDWRIGRRLENLFTPEPDEDSIDEVIRSAGAKAPVKIVVDMKLVADFILARAPRPFITLASEPGDRPDIEARVRVWREA